MGVVRSVLAASARTTKSFPSGFSDSLIHVCAPAFLPLLKVCGVVGSYSDLLLKLRTEIFSCLFKNFDADALPASPADYSNLLPYFMEYTRLESERKNHAKRKKHLPVREPLPRTPRAPGDMPYDA